MTINTHLLDLPESVSEMVTVNEDGSVSIFLNARHSHEKQIESYEHAMDHIKNNDFDSDLSVQEIESQYDT